MNRCTILYILSIQSSLQTLWSPTADGVIGGLWYIRVTGSGYLSPIGSGKWPWLSANNQKYLKRLTHVPVPSQNVVPALWGPSISWVNPSCSTWADGLDSLSNWGLDSEWTKYIPLQTTCTSQRNQMENVLHWTLLLVLTLTRSWKEIEFIALAASESVTNFAWYSRTLRMRRGPSTDSCTVSKIRVKKILNLNVQKKYVLSSRMPGPVYQLHIETPHTHITRQSTYSVGIVQHRSQPHRTINKDSKNKNKKEICPMESMYHGHTSRSVTDRQIAETVEKNNPILKQEKARTKLAHAEREWNKWTMCKLWAHLAK